MGSGQFRLSRSGLLLCIAALVGRSHVVHAQRRGTPPAMSTAEIQLYARLLRAADQRNLDSAAIRESLASRSDVVRQMSIRTLAQLAPTHRGAALPWLRLIANDTVTNTAATAAFGLGLVRDTASIPLLDRLARSGNAAGQSAAWALGEIGLPAQSSITDLLTGYGIPTASRSAAVTRALLLAAAKLRPVNFAVIAPFLRSSDPTVRWAAAYAVARQRLPAAANALMRAPRPDAAFRAEVARELTAPTVGDSLSEPAFMRLGELSRDADPHVRINALRSLGTYGARSRDILLGSMHDPDANVRVTAAQSVLTAFEHDSATWQTAWNADTGYKFRKSLIQSAAEANVPLSADSAWRHSPDWRLRAAAVAAWSSSHDTARARLIAFDAAHDTDGRVRANAYEVLASSDTGRRDSIVQAALQSARSDPDPVSRESLPGYKSSVSDSSAAGRPLEWYVQIVRRIVVPALGGRPQISRLSTSRGEITILLDGAQTPLTVSNYITLANQHVYDHARFHRVVPAFVAQDGDPRGDGNGGPGYSIRDELNLAGYSRGAVGMALSGPDTGGSQYFLTLTPQPHLDGHYTLFGHVIGGLAVMDALVEGDMINSVQVRW